MPRVGYTGSSMATATTALRYQVGAPVLGNPTSVQETTDLRQHAELDCRSENAVGDAINAYFPATEAAAAQTHVTAGSLVRRTAVTSDGTSVVAPRAIPFLSSSNEPWTGFMPVALSKVVEKLTYGVDPRDSQELAENLFRPFLMDTSIAALDAVATDLRAAVTDGGVLRRFFAGAGAAAAAGAAAGAAAASIAGAAAVSPHLSVAVMLLAAAQKRAVQIANQVIDGEELNAYLAIAANPFTNPAIDEPRMKAVCVQAHEALQLDIGAASALTKIRDCLWTVPGAASQRFVQTMESMDAIQLGLNEIVAHCRANVGQYDPITAIVLLTSDGGAGMVRKFASVSAVAVLLGYLVPRLFIIMDMIRNPFSGVVYTDHDDGDDHKVSIATFGQISVSNVACRHCRPSPLPFRTRRRTVRRGCSSACCRSTTHGASPPTLRRTTGS